ncbi:VPLPA-CTERM sorting domain-containing protein [Rhodovulum sp. DZ06]|uniref:VPLPA-CTERM sorting domain-containing protein n=1 Tax=Rhodovulum sp. DZ06 TaxID=3425126 RepID=UPI003D353597
MKRFATCAAAALLLSAAPAAAATLVNGSMTGTPSNAAVPSGWTILEETPDTSDVTGAAGGLAPYVVTPLGPSPDGGTFVGIARGENGFSESFGQSIVDFVVGETYELSWYAGNFGASSGTVYDGTNAVEVLLDGALVGTGADVTLGRAWTSQAITFTATAGTHLLAFALRDAVNSYIQIDGVALTVAGDPGPSDVPLPAAAPLLLLGLGGLAALRRKG